MCAIRSGSPGFFQFLTNQKTSFIVKQGKAVLTEIRLVDIGYQETLIHPLTPIACYEIGLKGQQDQHSQQLSASSGS